MHIKEPFKIKESQLTGFLFNKEITYEAKGLCLFLLSRSEGYKIRLKTLINESPAGRDKVSRIVNELIEHGYLFREELRNDKGQFSDCDYYLNREKFVGA